MEEGGRKEGQRTQPALLPLDIMSLPLFFNITHTPAHTGTPRWEEDRAHRHATLSAARLTTPPRVFDVGDLPTPSLPALWRRFLSARRQHARAVTVRRDHPFPNSHAAVALSAARRLVTSDKPARRTLLNRSHPAHYPP